MARKYSPFFGLCSTYTDVLLTHQISPYEVVEYIGPLFFRRHMVHLYFVILCFILDIIMLQLDKIVAFGGLEPKIMYMRVIYLFRIPHVASDL